MADIYLENLERAERDLDIELPEVRNLLEREGIFEGQEHYLSVLYGEQTGLLDYVPEGCYLVLDDPDGIAAAADNAWSACVQIAQRQKKRRSETEPLPAQCVLRQPETVLRQLEHMPRVLNRALGCRSEDVVDFGGQSGRHYEGHVATVKRGFAKALAGRL